MQLLQLFKITLTTLILLVSSISFGQDSDLKISEIMKGNEFIGHQPFDFKWGSNSDFIYFRWNQDNKLVAPYYAYSVQEK